MTVDREMCFDPITQMNCNPNREPNPLLANRTIFFAVQPRFQNVDIRLFLDVTKGGECMVYPQGFIFWSLKSEYIGPEDLGP